MLFKGTAKLNFYAAALAAGAALALPATQAHAADVVYYGCVTTATGAIRIVSATTTCKASEHKIN